MDLRPVPRIFLFTALALLAFAGNSLLCRLALRGGHADPAAFTLIRLASGAAVLWVVLKVRRVERLGGSWPSALALFIYAIAFSFAYVTLSAGTGALLLFGAVQASMLLAGFIAGERPSLGQGVGLAAALAGLVYLVLPGLEAPSPQGAALMAAAGVAWGVYSLRGRRAGDPTSVTAGNFLRAVPLSILATLFLVSRLEVDPVGWALALASGAVTSGLGYVIWYAALKDLTATRAAVVQLSVPVIAALGGVLLLGEALSTRLVVASCVILGGVALAVLGKQARSASVVRPRFGS
ncbi:MAG TPA: DMT family transporter [Gammaproteobacteria bacterium]|jgi:drug/metabolite transporter (DMT)-like permease